MSPKAKVQVAREHLTKAQDDAAGGDVRDASIDDVLPDVEDAVAAAEAEAT